MNKNTYTFNRGKGYIEKDWGKSMPSWIWINPIILKIAIHLLPFLLQKSRGWGFLLLDFLAFTM